ncbi:unnamed protein product [Bursaphelenchus xylophilus]|uniref:Short-chain dehydrogenase/reductase 3 n=1 Tax=Bursaphelenchus xylophilus TaxID=6326 RepID=A0A1I7RIE7_BURXY|nr:unnamed protein product [Bursaphelenchus xylophilus]CAG9080845.1 unnamed protein product [Bursaphelenchus xylophilus]
MSDKYKKRQNEFYRMTDASNPIAYGVRYVLEVFRWIFFVIYSIGRGIFRTIVPNSVLRKKSLNGKTILLTGAGGGIGRELAKQLAEQDARLVLWDLSSVGNDETAQICQKIGAKVYCQTVDVTDRKAVYRAADELRNDFGEPDILINNAGVLNASPFLECNDDKMSKLIDVNTKSLFWVTKAFLPKMVDRGSGHVVTLASIAAILGAPLLVDYAASKHAAFGFMQSLQLQLQLMKAPPIAFTTICPYYTTTPMINDLKSQIVDSRFALLTSEYVAKKTIEAIRLEQRVLIMPNEMAAFYSIFSLLPWNLGESIILRRRVY